MALTQQNGNVKLLHTAPLALITYL